VTTISGAIHLGQPEQAKAAPGGAPGPGTPDPATDRQAGPGRAAVHGDDVRAVPDDEPQARAASAAMPGDAMLDILHALERGDITVDEAAARLEPRGAGGDPDD
jgi:hypothetical protein